MKALLEIRDLGLSYRVRGEMTSQIGPVTLDLFEGEFFGLVGESGAGKSTLGYEILGLLRVKGGVRLRGQILTAVPPEKMAYIPQDPFAALDPLFSIGTQLRELQVTQEQINAALNRVHLSLEKISLKSYPHELSGGMRQRLVIAMALLRDPVLLIADEPTSSLDLPLQAEIMKCFQSIHESGVSVFFITHNLPLAANYCQRMAVMRHGRILQAGTPDEIFGRNADPYIRELAACVPVLKP